MLCGPWEQYPNIINNSEYHIFFFLLFSLFFPHLLAIFVQISTFRNLPLIPNTAPPS